MNLFRNNSSQPNPIINPNRPPVNLFNNPNQNLNNQNHQNPTNLPNVPKPPQNLFNPLSQPQKILPPLSSNPPNRISESLYQNHSFAAILQKVRQKPKVTQSELEFLTHRGRHIFEKNEENTNHFNNVKAKEQHLGYGPEVTFHQGDVMKCEEINKIWIKLIKHFAYICDTNEMNGYYILKHILIEKKYYEYLYKPKSGLGNRIFEPNQQRVREFYIFSNGSMRVNKDGNIYREIISQMVHLFILEYFAFFNIVEIVGTGSCWINSGRTISNSFKRQAPRREQAEIVLTFGHLEQQNIIRELWEMYKNVAISKAISSNSEEFKNDKAKENWQRMKKKFPLKICNILTMVINAQFTQEKLMEKIGENLPIPLPEVIEFITDDIQKLRFNNIMDLAEETVYVKANRDLVLALIPFASFYQNNSILNTYFQLPTEIERFANARDIDKRQRLLQHLGKIKIDEFDLIAILAREESRRIDLIKEKRNDTEERQKKRAKDAVIFWENYFSKNSAELDIFQDKKWKYWIGLWVDNLSINEIVKSSLLRSYFRYYCKRMLKGNGNEFLKLWKDITEHTDSQIEMKTKGKSHQVLAGFPELVNPRPQQKNQLIFKLPPRIMQDYDHYVMGEFLRIIVPMMPSEELNVCTVLIKTNGDQKQENLARTKDLFCFLQSKKFDQQNDYHQTADQQKVDKTPLGDMAANVVEMISLNLGIGLKRKNNENQVVDNFKIVSNNVQKSTSIEQEVKFLCELVVQNLEKLQEIENYFFGQHINKNPVEGIRICIFLCKILSKLQAVPKLSVLQTMRYLIRAIDSLFNCEVTRELILCAISVVFPGSEGSQKGSTWKINDDTVETRAEGHYRKMPSAKVSEIMSMIQRDYSQDAVSMKSLNKLRKTISYHFNSMIKRSDCIDDYFPIDQHYSNAQLYQKIEEEIAVWNFESISEFLMDKNRQFRDSNWFYTFGRVMQNQNLLPIDIDSIIETMRKMRVLRNSRYASKLPLARLMGIINHSNVMEQLLKHLKPIGCENKVTSMIENEQMALARKEPDIRRFEPNGMIYSKYESKQIVDRKTFEQIYESQSQTMRTICMFARLVEEVLRLKLHTLQLGYPTILEELQFFNTLFYKITVLKEQEKPNNSAGIIVVKEVTESTDAERQTPVCMNIIASIVALLNLYTQRFKFPKQFSHMSQELRPILNLIEESQSENNLAFEKRWSTHQYVFRAEVENSEIYSAYREEYFQINPVYYDSVLYEMTDLSFENDDTSLRGIVFSILQLLFEHNFGETVAQAIADYQYPLKFTGSLADYSMLKRHLSSIQHKDLSSLLFFHINHTLRLSSSPNVNIFKENILNIVRTLEMLSVIVSQPYFASHISNSLPIIRICIVQLIKFGMNSDKICSKLQYINVLNKITLFVLRFLETMQKILSQSDFQQVVITNFLINPQNILKMLFQRMAEMLDHFRMDARVPIVLSASDHFLNYGIQASLTRKAIYRATYDMLIRIVMIVHEHMRRDLMAEIVNFLLNKNLQAITMKPLKLKENWQMKKHSGTISEVIERRFGVDTTIQHTKLSEKVVNFFYCGRMNYRKYGPNFMEDQNYAFQQIRDANQEKQENASDFRLKMRKQIFLIQIKNCMISMEYAYESMVRSYFMLMDVLTSAGSVGQNLTNFENDRTVPKQYENSLFWNKYRMKNQFSFVECIHKMSVLIMPRGDETIGKKMIEIMEELLKELVAEEQQNHDLEFRSTLSYENQSMGIPINMVFIQKEPLDIEHTTCLNPSRTIEVMDKISNSLMEYLTLYPENRHTLDRYTQFLLNEYQRIHKFPMSLRVTLRCYVSILTQFKKIIEITKHIIDTRKATYKEVRRHERRDGQEREIHNLEDWFKQKLKDQSSMREKIIQDCRSMLFRFYENRKHGKFTLNQEQNEYASRQLRKMPENRCIEFAIEQQELEKNFDLILVIAREVYSKCGDQLFNNNFKQNAEARIQQTVSYIATMLIRKPENLSSTATKVMLYSLCNEIYAKNETSEMKRWDFEQFQFNDCLKILQTRPKRNETSCSYLERIAAFQFFTAYLLSGNSGAGYVDTFPIIMRIVDFEQNLYWKNAREKHTRQDTLQNISSRDWFEPRYFLGSSSKENYMNVTLEKLFQYKMLLLMMLHTLPVDQWNETDFESKANALFEEILKFSAIQFSTCRVEPFKKVQARLNQLIVYDEVLKKGQIRPVPGHLESELSNNLSKRNLSLLNSASMGTENFSRPPRHIHNSIQESYKNEYQNKSTYGNNMTNNSMSRSLSLFDFICFVQHSEIVNIYLRSIKVSIEKESVLRFYAETQKNFSLVWNKLYEKVHDLYDYFTEWCDLLLDSPKMLGDLVTLYNYVIRDPNYMKEFDSITMFFETIDSNRVKEEIVEGALELCDVVMGVTSKIKDFKPLRKSEKNKEQRIICLKKCLKLIENPKIGNFLRQIQGVQTVLKPRIENLHLMIRIESEKAFK